MAEGALPVPVADRDVRVVSRSAARFRAAVAVVLVVGALNGPAAGAGPSTGAVVARQAEPGSPQIPVNPDANPERAKRTADEILRGDEYRSPDEQGKTVLDRIREWLDRRIDLPRAGQRGSGALDAGAWIVMGVVVIGGLAAATWAIAGSRRRRTAPDEEADSDIDITPLRTSDEWEEEAERCERSGDHKGAVRARFRSLTTLLARRGLVADTPGRTAGEMRGDVADRAPVLVPAFEAVADLFERAWFGPGPVGSDDSSAARQLADNARKAAPREATIGPEGDGSAPSVVITGESPPP